MTAVCVDAGRMQVHAHKPPIGAIAAREGFYGAMVLMRGLLALPHEWATSPPLWLLFLLAKYTPSDPTTDCSRKMQLGLCRFQQLIFSGISMMCASTFNSEEGGKNVLRLPEVRETSI